MAQAELSDPLIISRAVQIPWREIDMHAIRAQGAGGQNVNKVASAIHLRFDIRASSLPDSYKEQLLARSDQRITADGVVVIKAQQFRTQEQNREDALRRLQSLLRSANVVRKKRIATKPSKAAQRRRVDKKVKQGQIKKMRGKVGME
ncbi:peptidyl-tRNA hydrolase [Bacterioplanes sanyensis]|uniref:alternative ribosome rescue aminoacyl-tRNA hydrolase ArfB n=1 Tax=Bacterioplanes sanyensis TaxID=1249553 RepID=UPI001676F106|nr:alternative ribosome rescue aminoacyl-tRNA hydrolase ArfB [Bacterioplanes sanyensis]GGY36516.1 peptidyl-tRNA hydrolase [Bacterioplanes sanyensis]